MSDFQDVIDSLTLSEKHIDLTKALECARNGDPRAEKVLEEVYREMKHFCCDKAGKPENDSQYHYYTATKDHWQEKVMELRCANNRRELRNLKSQVTDTVATVDRLSQQLEESNARIREMGSKLDLLLTVVRDLVEKQTEDNERMKQQLEESNASNAEQLRSKHEVLLTVIRDQVKKQEHLTEDNARMKQQLEESNDDKDEMGCKLQLMLQVIKDLTEKQERMIEESARMKKEVEELNTRFKEISRKFKDISTEQKICKEGVRMKNPKETFTEEREKESE